MRPPLETLIETYRQNLYVAAFNVCKNAQDAEDVVQETFLQYWSQKKEFESEQHVRAWLFRVAINRAKNVNNSFSGGAPSLWRTMWASWYSRQRSRQNYLRR